MTTTFESFGARVRRMRLERGLSIRKLEFVLKTGRSTVVCWEKDKSVPGYWLLLELSKVFSVSLDYLMTGSDYHH